MSVDHEQLVAYALEQLEANERTQIEGALAQDAQLRAELELVREHLALHDAAPAVEPSPRVLVELRRTIQTGELPQRPLAWLGRFGMPIAAAALVALALFWPPTVPIEPVEQLEIDIVHGEVEPAPGRNLVRARRVTRYAGDDIASFTFDEGSVFSEPAFGLLNDPEIESLKPHFPWHGVVLQMSAGRVFVEADSERLDGGVLVFGGHAGSGAFTAKTLGTTFLVDLTGEFVRVAVESGSVACTISESGLALDAGESVELRSEGAVRGKYERAMRDWFTQPTLLAVLEDDETLRVTLRNDMPDPVLLEPPTGGEAPFYAAVDGRTFPLPRSRLKGYPLDGSPHTLAPGDSLTFTVDLPQPVPENSKLTLSDHRQKLRTVAEDRR